MTPFFVKPPEFEYAKGATGHVLRCGDGLRVAPRDSVEHVFAFRQGPAESGWLGPFDRTSPQSFTFTAPFQIAEVAVPGELFAAILERIQRFGMPPP